MPKQTFVNLSEKKKSTFIAAAMLEFSSLEYQQASISNIVRALSIAKGSVYQYFNNKLDLYKYLVNLSHEKLLEVQRFVDGRIYDDLKQWFVQRAIAEIRFAHEFKQEHELLHLTRSTHSLEIKTLSKELNEKEHDLLNHVIIKNQINANINNELAYVISAVKYSYVHDTYQTKFNAKHAIDELYRFSDIIFSR